MKRKIVKQAGKAYTITLPINWIRERGLKEGDELDIIARERGLLIETSNSVSKKKYSFSLKGFPFGIRYSCIAAAYARGIDELDLEVDKDVFPNLAAYLGYVVVDQKNELLTVHDINSSLSDDIDLVFKRNFQLTLNVFNQAITDILGDQKATYDHIRSIDSEINKLSFFLQRAIIKKNLSSSAQGKILFAYSYAMEKIGDGISRLWRLVTEGGFDVSDEVKELFSLVGKVLELSFSLYFRFNREMLLTLDNLKKSFRSKSIPLFTSQPSSARLLMYLSAIFDDSYDLIHLCLMKEFRPS